MSIKIRPFCFRYYPYGNGFGVFWESENTQKRFRIVLWNLSIGFDIIKNYGF